MTDAPERIWLWHYESPETDWIGSGLVKRYGANKNEDVGLDGDEIEYIRADLLPEWQPIETAPKDGTLIMGAWNFGGWSYCIMRHNGDGWTKRFDVQSRYNPTHWMPLPKPPKVSE